ncbi:hypothetical protein Tco_1369658 [Tanacetum coccineum]
MFGASCFGHDPCLLGNSHHHPFFFEKLPNVTHHHLLTGVLIKLDIDNWNYALWEYFFDKLCQGYEVAKYIHGDSTTTTTSTLTSFTPKELKVDIIDFVNYGGTQNNKRSRTIALKVELRSIKLGDLTINAYFRKTESFATILTTLGSSVSSEDVVTYALEGLPKKYDHVCGIISHRETFPDLKMARSILTTEDMRPGF